MPGDRNLNIRLTYSTAEADASAEAYAKREKQRIGEVLTAHQVADKAQMEMIKQANTKRVQEAIAASKAVANTEKATSEEIAAARGRMNTATITKIKEEQAARQQADDAARRNARMRFDIEMFQLKEHHEKTMAAWDAQQVQHAKLNSTITGGIKSVVGFGAAMVGLQGAQGVVAVFTDHFDRIRQYAAKAADEIQNMRESVRELQALRGELGVTGPGVAHLVAMSAQTLQRPEEVKAMEEAGLGLGELAVGEGKGKTMTRAEFDQFMVSAGKMQAMEGGNAGAWGEMAGLITLQSKGKLAPDEAEGKLNRMFEIQRPGAFTSMTQAIGQYQKMGALVSNDILTQEEAMGLVAAQASAGVKEEAGTHAQQLARAVLVGRIKSRGMSMSPDVDSEKTDQYMKGLGIAENDSVMERARKISDDLAKNTGPGKRNATEYMAEHGFGNEEERQALMSYSGLRNAGKLGDIEKAQNAPVDNGAITRRFEERKAHDPFLSGRAAQLSGQAANLVRGNQVENLRQINEAAFNSLLWRGEVSGDFKEYEQSWGISPRNLFGGDRGKVNAEAASMIRNQAAKAGVSSGMLPGQQYASDETLSGAMTRIRQAGVNPLGGVEGDIKAAAAALLKAAEALEKQTVKRAVPVPMPGKPAPAQTRVQ